MSHQPLPSESPGVAARARPPTFVCSHTHGGLDAAWVHVAGELDIASTPRLESKLLDLQPQARLVVVDLREVEFVDSSGVHALVDATSHARSAGRRVVLLRNPATLDRVFTLTERFQDVEIGDLHPTEPPVQVLLQLAQENALELAVTDTDEGRTLVSTMPADLSFMLADAYDVYQGRAGPTPLSMPVRAIRALAAVFGLRWKDRQGSSRADWLGSPSLDAYTLSDGLPSGAEGDTS